MSYTSFFWKTLILLVPYVRLFSVIIIIFPASFVDGLNYIRSFQKLIQVPRDIPRNTVKIYLNNNEISDIESGTFAKNVQWTKLRLDWNRLTEVRNDMW